jgi:hypothetical protein
MSAGLPVGDARFTEEVINAINSTAPEYLLNRRQKSPPQACDSVFQLLGIQAAKPQPECRV